MKTPMASRTVIVSFIAGLLLLVSPAILAAQKPVSCKALKSDLNKQINSLHKHQMAELAQCRKTNGKNSQDCGDLKSQQESKLNQLRKDRETQLANCHAQKKAR
jgi:hypothetical protein